MWSFSVSVPPPLKPLWVWLLCRCCFVVLLSSLLRWCPTHSILRTTYAHSSNTKHGPAGLRDKPTVKKFLLSNDAPFPDADAPAAALQRRDSTALNTGTLAAFLPSEQQLRAQASKKALVWITSSKKPSCFRVQDVSGAGMFSRQAQQLTALVGAVESRLGASLLVVAHTIACLCPRLCVRVCVCVCAMLLRS